MNQRSDCKKSNNIILYHKTDGVYLSVLPECIMISIAKTFFENRASGSVTSAQIHQLEVAAVTAVASGDKAAADAFQQAADQLRAQLFANRISLSRPTGTPSDAKAKDDKSSTAKPFDPRVVSSQWSALGAYRVHLSKTTCVLDCGARGMATITPTGITLSGSLQADPTALLLMARHAQLHWDGRATVAGSKDFKLGIAVAGAMVGVKTRRARIGCNQRLEAHTLTETMRPILSNITGVPSPSRPAAPGSPSTPRAMPSPAMPAIA
jgi:hypothetical protein